MAGRHKPARILILVTLVVVYMAVVFVLIPVIKKGYVHRVKRSLSQSNMMRDRMQGGMHGDNDWMHDREGKEKVGWMHDRMHSWMHGRKDKGKFGWMHNRKNNEKDDWMHDRMHNWMHGRKGKGKGRFGWMHERMHNWMHSRKGKGRFGWMHDRMHNWMHDREGKGKFVWMHGWTHNRKDNEKDDWMHVRMHNLMHGRKGNGKFGRMHGGLHNRKGNEQENLIKVKTYNRRRNDKISWMRGRMHGGVRDKKGSASTTGSQIHDRYPEFQKLNVFKMHKKITSSKRVKLNLQKKKPRKKMHKDGMKYPRKHEKSKEMRPSEDQIEITAKKQEKQIKGVKLKTHYHNRYKSIFHNKLLYFNTHNQHSVCPVPPEHEIEWILVYTWQLTCIIHLLVNIFRKTTAGHLYYTAETVTPHFCIIFIFTMIAHGVEIVIHEKSNSKFGVFTLAVLIQISLMVGLGLLYKAKQTSEPILRKLELVTDIWLTRILLINGVAFFFAWSMATTARALIAVSCMYFSPNIAFTIGHSVFMLQLLVLVPIDFLFHRVTKYAISPSVLCYLASIHCVVLISSHKIAYIIMAPISLGIEVFRTEICTRLLEN